MSYMGEDGFFLESVSGWSQMGYVTNRRCPKCDYVQDTGINTKNHRSWLFNI